MWKPKAFKLFLVATFFALFVHFFVLETFRVTSDSMIPTLKPGDLILVNKLSYNVFFPFSHRQVCSLGNPRVGDLVVFFRPGDTSDAYVKRVAAIANQSVPGAAGTFLIPNGHFWALGDNSGRSLDSRDWGPVPNYFLKGKVLIKIPALANGWRMLNFYF